MAFTTAGLVRLHYDVVGQGNPLCLVNGYRLSSAAWPGAFIDRLACRYTVITFDNRGTGLSDKPADGYRLDNQARDVAALLDELGQPRVHLLGYSMGGAIAQEFVAAFPGRVDRLVLFGTFCGGVWSKRASWSTYRRLLVTDGLSPEAAARQIWPVTYTPGYLAAHADAVEQQMRRELAHPTPPFVARRQMEALTVFDRHAELERIRSPTLVATGAEDELVMPGNSDLMAKRIPGARLERLAELGHRAIWEAPEEMADLIGDFLGQPLRTHRPTRAA